QRPLHALVKGGTTGRGAAGMAESLEHANNLSGVCRRVGEFSFHASPGSDLVLTTRLACTIHIKIADLARRPSDLGLRSTAETAGRPNLTDLNRDRTGQPLHGLLN